MRGVNALTFGNGINNIARTCPPIQINAKSHIFVELEQVPSVLVG